MSDSNRRSELYGSSEPTAEVLAQQQLLKEFWEKWDHFNVAARFDARLTNLASESKDILMEKLLSKHENLIGRKEIFVDPAISTEEMMDELQLNPDDYGLTVTVIGGVLFSDPRIGKITQYALSQSLGRVFDTFTDDPHFDDKKMAIVTSGTVMGIMGVSGAAAIHEEEAVVEDRRLSTIGIFPKEHIYGQQGYDVDQLIKDQNMHVADPFLTHNVYLEDPSSPDGTFPNPWDVTSEHVAHLSTELSRGELGTAVTVLVGGGEGALIELQEKLDTDEPIVVIAFSGRLADVLCSFRDPKVPLTEEEKRMKKKLEDRYGDEIKDKLERKRIVCVDPFVTQEAQDIPLEGVIHGLAYQIMESAYGG